MNSFDFRLLLIGAMMVPATGNADARLPDYLIRIPESVGTVFVAEVSTAKFHRFDRTDNGLEYAGSDTMSVGRDGAGKEKSGDRRTPLGVYFVTEELDTSRLHEKYGLGAFELDYPNAWDQRLHRTGDGIWVHGVDPRGGKRPALDTDGCIALSNEDLADLADVFQENITPVLIAREIDWRDGDDKSTIREELQKSLQRWSSSLLTGDLHAYLSLYDEDFERWQLQKPEWSALSLKMFAEREISEYAVDDLLLLGYPDVDGVYLSRFLQTVSEGSKRTTSIKRLYWRRGDDGTLKIIAEDSG